MIKKQATQERKITMKRKSLEGDEIEGFKFDANDDRYHCQSKLPNGKPCNRAYRYVKAAKDHHQFHEAGRDRVIPTGETNTKTRTRTKTLQGHEIQNPQDPTKGDLLRAMVEELKVGRINIPDLVMRLNSAALAMDILHRELEQSRAGGLLAKAEAWDKLVEMLPSIPGLYEMLLEAAKGKEG